MPSPVSSFRTRIESDQLVLCACLVIARTVDVPMLAAACGFDAIYVDMEHSATSVESMSMLCMAAAGNGLTPFVRVPSHEAAGMIHALDNGAAGVIVPHVETREQALNIVRSCRFPPVGDRSIIGPGPVNGYVPVPLADFINRINREAILCAMIESTAGVERCEQIVSVEGIDMIMVGPADLTADMGILGQFRDPRFLEAMERIAGACRKHGKVLGLAGIGDPELLKRFISLGLRFISAGTDSGFFMETARHKVSVLRGLEPK
jgi:4-hydroxy-2-oxoheptanedioate aldolase